METSTQEVDLKSTARIAQIVGLSLVVWVGEAFLVYYLLSVRAVPGGAPWSLYLLPIAHILPWVVAMQRLWKARSDSRSGALDEAGFSRCYGIIEDILGMAYVALSVIETTLILPWKL